MTCYLNFCPKSSILQLALKFKKQKRLMYPVSSYPNRSTPKLPPFNYVNTWHSDFHASRLSSSTAVNRTRFSERELERELEREGIGKSSAVTRLSGLAKMQDTVLANRLATLAACSSVVLVFQ